MNIRYQALPVGVVEAIRSGGPDAYGAPAERAVSDGDGKPCRCCLRDIPDGAEMLILAHRPFPATQPYAETGPIFLCAACDRAEDSEAPPEVVARREALLVKGYTSDHRIRYGTGRITPAAEVGDYCAALLALPEIAFVDIRSSQNNCFVCRVADVGPDAAEPAR